MAVSNNALKAILFDFDGVIVDTESVLFQSWQDTCAAHGCALSIEQWAANVGGYSYDIFDPLGHIETQCGHPIDREAVNTARRACYLHRVHRQDAMPGIPEAFEATKTLGLKLAVVSSSSINWVTGHLKRLALDAFVDVYACGNEVENVKPDPAVYHLALERLHIGAAQAIAIEDSPKGVAAAKTAGIYCVAAPNPVTRHAPLNGHNRLVPSLADNDFRELVTNITEELRTQ